MIRKVDILAIGAHPDDVELGCSGTLFSMVAQGKEVAIIDLTQGELGTRGTAKTRKIEAERAQKILGIPYRENLQFADGFFEHSQENILKVVEKIRKYRPKIVLCNAISDRHPNHVNGSKLVSDACFLSGLPKVETFYNDQKQLHWRPKHVFHYIQWENIKPDFCIDISSFVDKKVEVCLAYKTQFYDGTDTEKTPISTQNFLQSIRYRAQDLGRLIGVDAAEGFTVEKPICFSNFNGFL